MSASSQSQGNSNLQPSECSTWLTGDEFLSGCATQLNEVAEAKKVAHNFIVQELAERSVALNAARAEVIEKWDSVLRDKPPRQVRLGDEIDNIIPVSILWAWWSEEARNT